MIESLKIPLENYLWECTRNFGHDRNNGGEPLPCYPELPAYSPDFKFSNDLLGFKTGNLDYILRERSSPTTGYGSWQAYPIHPEIVIDQDWDMTLNMVTPIWGGYPLPSLVEFSLPFNACRRITFYLNGATVSFGWVTQGWADIWPFGTVSDDVYVYVNGAEVDHKHYWSRAYWLTGTGRLSGSDIVINKRGDSFTFFYKYQPPPYDGTELDDSVSCSVGFTGVTEVEISAPEAQVGYSTPFPDAAALGLMSCYPHPLGVQYFTGVNVNAIDISAWKRLRVSIYPQPNDIFLTVGLGLNGFDEYLYPLTFLSTGVHNLYIDLKTLPVSLRQGGIRYIKVSLDCEVHSSYVLAPDTSMELNMYVEGKITGDAQIFNM